MSTADGTVRLFEYTRTPVRDESGRIIGIAGVARDVTERVRAEQRIRYLAEYDQLTDLPNRIVLGERLAEMVAAPFAGEQSLALMMVDLDRFKHINETLGHDVGDRLLQQLASRLKELVGERGLVSRHGGDKFAVLLTHGGGAVATALFAKEVIEAAKRPYVIGSHEFTLSASIGIAMYPQDGTDLHALLKNADAAMYHAKEAGRGSFQFFSPEMNVRVFERLSMENGLRKALEQHEFQVHYQPKFAVADRRLTGFEALLRWPHPVQGMISPARFIPVAEDTQLIVPIGEWVLFEACRQNRAWQLAGYENVPVAVNLSMVQFRQRNLVEMVANALITTGLEPRYLELEITESVVMHDSEQVIGVLDQLKCLGVMLSIDDFGTGYSSLSYLKRFPIDKIKIDYSFVQHLPEGENDAAIAETIIAIAGKLDLGVVAEGVGSEAQLDYLQSRGCDEAQGFLFSPALPAGEAERFLSLKGGNGVASPVPIVQEGNEDAG
jgi:diguanylate cyclase (GGDEF)-like protein